MKPCSSNYARASKPRKDEPNCVNEWQLSIPWPMLAAGKDDAPVIAVCARISLICAVALSYTICMSWLVLSRKLLSFRMLLDFLTGALADYTLAIGTALNLEGRAPLEYPGIQAYDALADIDASLSELAKKGGL